MMGTGDDKQWVSIRELQLIYDDAFANFDGPKSPVEAASFGERLAKRTQSTVNKSTTISTEDAKVLARRLGIRKALAQSAGASVEVISADADFAALLKNTVFTNRDEARDYASEALFQAAERLIEIGEKEYAAMQLSNAAEVLLEKHRISDQDAERAKSALERSTGWRRKGSVDMGVHLVNFALLRKTLIRKGVDEPSPQNLQNVMRTLERGFKLVSQHGAAIDQTLGDQDIEEIYHHNVVELLDLWLNVELSREELNFAASVSGQVSGILNLGEVSRETVAGVVSLLRVNPKSLGVEETPQWVLPRSEIIDRACKAIPRFESRLESAVTYSERNPDAQNLASVLQRIQKSMDTFEQATFPAFLTALESAFSDADDQLFLQRILSLVQNIDLVPLDQTDRYVAVLGRTPVSLSRAKKRWETQRFRDFMLDYRLELRWIACELAQAKQWREAYELLTAVAGAVATSHSVNSDRETALTSESTHIFLTHGPRGTYAVGLNGDEFFGEIFPLLPGTALVQRFAGIKPPGLLNPILEASKRDELAQDIRADLGLVGDWLADIKASEISVTPSGFFQAFPIWSLGKLCNKVLNEEKRVFQVPWHQRDDKTPGMCSNLGSLRIEEASDVFGFRDLEGAKSECDWLSTEAANKLRVDRAQSSPTTFVEAVSQYDVVHFAGHSLSDVNPMDSALITHGGEVDIASILSTAANAKLVVLNSCESALAKNVFLQNEYLGIASALWYSGVKYVIGTSWSVSDRAGHVFTEAFYRQLLREKTDHGSMLRDAIYRSWLAGIKNVRADSERFSDWGAHLLIG